MKVRTIIQIVLAVVIVGLGFLLFKNIKKDIDFDNIYNERRDACAERLKVVRTLEEAYMKTYHVYCGDFDTLINRLMSEDSLLIPKEEYDSVAIMNAVRNEKLLKDFTGKKSYAEAVREVQNMSSEQARKERYIKDTLMYVNALQEMREKGTNKDLIIKDPKSGVERPITDEEIRNCRYVPGFDKSKEFKLVARQHEGSWVFQAWIDFEDLYVGKNIDPALLENKIAAINEKSKKLLADNPENDPIYTSWRVGDTLKPETRGNFE
jgi:hypothetical protein